MSEFAVFFLPAGVNATTNANGKKFRFRELTHVALLRAVQITSKHVAEYRKAGENHEEVLAILSASSEFKEKKFSSAVTAKSLRDGNLKLMAGRKRSQRVNTAESGVPELYSDDYLILDDIIIQVNEMSEEDRAKKMKRSGVEEILQKVRGNAGQRALRQSGMESEVMDANESSEDPHIEIGLV